MVQSHEGNAARLRGPVGLTAARSGELVIIPVTLGSPNVYAPACKWLLLGPGWVLPPKGSSRLCRADSRGLTFKAVVHRGNSPS